MIAFIGNKYEIDDGTIVHCQDTDFLRRCLYGGPVTVANGEEYVFEPQWISFDRIVRKIED